MLEPLQTDTANGLDLTDFVFVCEYTTNVGAMVFPQVRFDGLATGERQTITLKAVVVPLAAEYPGKRGSQIKDAANQSIMILTADSMCHGLLAGWTYALYAKSSSAGDTSIDLTVDWIDPPPSTASIADAVWTHATRTLSSFGGLVASIWTHATRGLTENVATDAASREASKADVSALATTSGLGTLQSHGDSTWSTANTSTLATAANQTTILNRLGAWTGSARNTVLGAIQALFRSDADATVPSDVNANLGNGAGTADNTTDSVQAIRDHGDDAWVTGGGDDLSDIEDSLDTLLDRTAEGIKVTHRYPYANPNSNQLQLNQGDTRTSAVDNPITETVQHPGVSTAILSDDTTATMYLQNIADTSDTLTLTGTIASVTDNIATINFELTQAQAAGLASGCPAYREDLEIVFQGDPDRRVVYIAGRPVNVYVEISNG